MLNKKYSVSTVLRFFFAVIGFWLAWVIPAWGGHVYMATPTLQGGIPITTWKDLRDDRVVKQDLDYSCGAASVATILGEYYQKKAVTEQRILQAMDKDMAASFSDLSEVVKNYGLKGVGLALDFEQLKQLKTPAIAYLEYRGDAHFSVIRGISPDGHVHLGDSSWGNRVFSSQQFLAMWETRGNAALKGKILLLLPVGNAASAVDSTFFKAPPLWSTLAESLLGLRS